MITQRYLTCFLTHEKTLRSLAKYKRRRGSLCKDSLKICLKDFSKPTKVDPAADSACTLPPLRPLALCSVPVYTNTTFCGPCFYCNPCGCTPCKQCCSPSCCNCNPSCWACNPGCYTCNTNCPLFQPYYHCCPCSCARESNIKCAPCVLPQCAPGLPLCKEESVIEENPSEIIFMNKGKVVHQNRRFTAIGVDNEFRMY